MKKDILFNRTFASLLVVILSCSFGVILFELSLRIVNYDNDWIKTEEANILKDFQFSYDASHLYKSDFSSINYVRNEYALRDACESPSDIDILTVGGSTTDQRYVPYEFTYQAILEERLKEVFDDFGCVSNAGVDGHSTWGHIFSFEHWFPLIPGLKPKFIVLYLGVNDANFFSAIAPNPGDNNSKEQGIKSFFKNFYTVRALLPLYRFLKQHQNPLLAYGGHAPLVYNLEDYEVERINPKTKSLSEVNVNAFKIRMITLLDHIKALNAVPICVTQPHRFVIEKNGQTLGIPSVLGEGFSGLDYDYSIGQLNKVMFDLCGENTLDLYSQNFLEFHFYDGVHTTALGSQKIGNKLADFIIQRFF